MTWSTVFQPKTARSRHTRSSSSGATSMLDLCLSMSAPMVALAPAYEGRRDFAADSEASRSGRRSGSCGEEALKNSAHWKRCRSINRGMIHLLRSRIPQPPHDANSRSNAACGGLVSDDCKFGLGVVASLGRRRTSTVNDGTARLNVVLDTAYSSAESARPKRPCEAMPSKAIADHLAERRQSCQQRPPTLQPTAYGQGRVSFLGYSSSGAIRHCLRAVLRRGR